MSEDALSDVKVGVLPRVIAAGMRFRDGQWKLHATLSLMPWVVDDKDKANVELSEWPSEINRLVTDLGKLKLFISPITAAAAEGLICPTLDKDHSVEATPLADISASVAERDALWQRLIADDNPRAWNALVDGLKESQRGSSLANICQNPTTSANGGTPQVDNAGGADKSAQGSPAADVIELPRADAALLYGFQRAREVLRAMQRKEAQSRVNSCIIKTGGRFLDFADFSFEKKPWLGLDHEPPVRFAQATSSDAAIVGAQQGFARRDELLARERKEQEAKYQENLGPTQRQKAEQQNSSRTNYLNGGSAPKRVQALQDHAKVRATSRAPNDCADACSASDDTSVNKATDDVKTTHALGAMPDLDEFGNPMLSSVAMKDAFELADEQAQQRLFAITAMPSLARLFNLVVDVELDLAGFKSAIGTYSPIFHEDGAVDHWGELTEGARRATPAATSPPIFMLLTTNLGWHDDKPSSAPYVWTYAKFRAPPDEDSKRDPGHFWPCSREEVDLQLYAFHEKAPDPGLREGCAVFQYDGVVDLGVVYCPDGLARNPRYDLVSLDTIQTVESDMQLDRRFNQMAGAAPGDQPPSSRLGVQTRRTGGLALIDRWRQDQAVSQIATANFHIDNFKRNDSEQCSSNNVILDAEDMTTAYRLDVGVDTGAESEDESGMVWRSLMNRKLTFGSQANKTDWVEKVVAALYTWKDEPGSKAVVERRRRADGASLSISSRIRQNAAQQGSSGENTAFVEQIMVTWHGDPLGVDCLDPGESTGSVAREDQGMSIPANALPLDISFGLEDASEAYRPPPLRYGWPYHFGLRPVYLGGVILPIESAVPRYEQNFKTGSALPNRDQFEGRRFLRHERVEAPVLTVPDGIAQRLISDVTSEIRQQDPVVLNNGGGCILRTWRIGSPRVKEPDATVRILLPPVMELNQAMLHGVFEKDAGEDAIVDGRHVIRPKDGLKSLDFSGDRGANAAQLGGFPHSVNAKNPGDSPRGPAVFRLGGDSKSRRIPFYPDPAAAFYVVTARRAGSDDDYLDGAPIVVPVSGKGAVYPDVFPLALEIRKQAAPRPCPAKCLKDLFPSNAVLAHADKSGTVGVGGGMAVQHLVAELAPGEDFEIDVWCIPNREELLDKFDIVEAVTVLMMRESAVENFADGIPNLACVSSLARHFPDKVKELNLKGLPLNPICGPGGMVLPHDTIIGWVADAIISALCSRPMPELSAVTTLHAVHAVDMPLQDPQFILDSVLDQPQIVRLNDDMLQLLMAAKDEHRCKKTSDACGKAAENCKDCARASRLIKGYEWNGLSDDGATNAVVNAKIGIDLLTTFDVELQARMVSPASGVFDNVNRGRTAEEKARGAYRPFGWVPNRVVGESVSPLATQAISSQWPRLTAEAVAKDSVQLFGFRVDQWGHAELARYWAPLMRLNHLPDVALHARDANLRTLCLLEEQQKSSRLNPQPTKLPDANSSKEQGAQPKAQGVQAKYIQPFRDGLARKFELRLVATSRFSNLFPDDDNMAQRVRTSKPAYAWLPATKRPDPLSARSLRPAFTWIHGKSKPEPSIWNSNGTRNVATVVRHCAIRLPFDRPHFTSGEGERVGVVIWPPDLMLGADPKGIEDDLVRRSEQAGQTLQLDDAFSDSDLGPGGEYVTRWGADPIRRGPRPKGWLIPARAFVDAGNPDVEFEPNVLMPIPRKPDASSSGSSGVKAGGSGDGKSSSSDASTSSDTAGREFMLVSLLTYEPRFDIDFERWYIDIHIDADQVPEPFIRLGLVRFQEHARRELQVSEPIAEWIQVMPKRAISVSVEAPLKATGRTELSVEVGTPALYEGAAPLLEVASDHAGASGDAPFMRAYLLREDRLNGGGSVQSIVPPEENFNALSTQLLPRRTSDGTVWGASIGFVCDAPRDGSEVYSVYIEEVEAYQSTANPVDDLTGLPTPSVVESGPRFAAIIPIKIPTPVSSPQPSPVSSPPPSPPHHPVKEKPVHPKPTYSKPPPAKEPTYD